MSLSEAGSCNLICAVGDFGEHFQQYSEENLEPSETADECITSCCRCLELLEQYSEKNLEPSKTDTYESITSCCGCLELLQLNQVVNFLRQVYPSDLSHIAISLIFVIIKFIPQ